MMTQLCKRVEFLTKDRVTIVGDWCPPITANGWCVVLLHMMPAERGSWKEFSQLLVAQHWATLALDLRGHGESTNRGDEKIDYHTFTNVEHSQKQLDVEAAFDWLSNQGFSMERTFIVGASIGANLALAAAARHHSIPGVITLSPGLQYGGIDARACAKNLLSEQRALFLASRDDPHSTETIQILAQETRAQHDVRLLTSAGHGTTMFLNEQGLQQEVVEWLSRSRLAKGGEQ